MFEMPNPSDCVDFVVGKIDYSQRQIRLQTAYLGYLVILDKSARPPFFAYLQEKRVQKRHRVQVLHFRNRVIAQENTGNIFVGG